MELSDESLVLAFGKTGDEAALAALVERHWKTAHRLASRMLRDPGAAEDAAQEALVGLVRGAKRFEEGRPFAPWFRTLVLNAVRTSARARRRRDAHERKAP